jgi:phage protein D
MSEAVTPGSAGAPGGAGQPRLKVLANGNQVPALTASVTQNSHYAGDRFRAEITLRGTGSMPLSWWSDTAPVLIDVQISLDGQSYTSLIIGEIDHVDINPVTGLVDINGRDLTARLIDAKTQETFLNQTSSQVATTLAGRHGLTPVVTATTTLVSRYYQQDHDKITTNQFARTTTEWDLLTFLAQQEGFDVFVKGTELHFQPATSPDDAPYVIIYDGSNAVPTLNAIEIKLSRALTLAKDLIVQVRSWRSAEGRGFTKTARLTGAKSAGSKGTTVPPQKFVFVRPNLTEDQAQNLANSKLADISKHERLVNVRMPGELTLTPRNIVRLDGTGSSWDQTYFIAEITREIGFDPGFWMSMDLKNHSADSEVLAQ